MNKIEELREQIKAKSKSIKDIFDEAGPDLDMKKIKSLEGDTAAKLESIRTMNNELDALHKEMDELRELSDIREKADKAAGMKEKTDVRGNPGDTGQKEEKKSIGELFVEGFDPENKYKDFNVDVDLKTAFTSSAGWDPEIRDISRVSLYPAERISVINRIPILNTDRDTISYMKETTFTNNAAERSEAGALGESAIALTRTQDEVESVGTWIPVTEEQLEDVGGLSQYLNARLSYMVKARVDSQILQGDGSTPNLLGTAHLSSVQTQAKSTDPTPDAFFKAMTKVRGASAGSGFAEPSDVFIHPNDWQSIRLLRTADGIYIFGNPMDPGPERLWGVQVTVTTAASENTGIVGDYIAHSAAFMRRGIRFKVSDSHASYFIYNTVAIKADIRMAMVHFRDTAFCTVTGI